MDAPLTSRMVVSARMATWRIWNGCCMCDWHYYKSARGQARQFLSPDREPRLDVDNTRP